MKNKTGENKKKRKTAIVLISMASALVLMVIGWWIFCIAMYNSNFNVRCDEYKPLMLRVEDFEGLQCEEYTFTSNKGQELAGYLYSVGEDQKGIVIIAHGFGGGHNSYMDAANYFAQNGYFIFAYDATGCENSQGEGVGGVPQGVIDLDYAISFVEANEDIPELPIVLFGHSWGAYSVSAVLTYHPEVKGVIACAGFNRSSDMFESGGKSQAGAILYAMTPFIRAHEQAKYGEYASNTAMDGFAKAENTSVMIVHSADDGVIGIEYGYDKYYEKYKDDSRFTFVRFDDKGHNNMLKDPNNTYVDELNADFAEWLKTLDYDYNSKDNRDQFIQDKAQYLNENLDHARYSHRLDETMFAQFLDFYNQAIQ